MMHLIIALLFVVASVAFGAELPTKRGTARPTTLGKECAGEISPDTGTPVEIPAHGPLLWGVSARPVVIGQEVLALLWLYNPTDKPIGVMTCSDIDAFWFSAMDGFDPQGLRVPSRTEEERKTWPPAWKKRPELEACLRNFPIEIHAHSCRHGTFSKAEADFSHDLRSYYTLPAGHYFVVPAEDRTDGAPAKRTVIEPKNGLEVTVLEE